MLTCFRRVTVILIALAILPSSARAWGCSGHHIIALIAERHLNPRALAATQELLKAVPVAPDLSRFCKDGQADPFVSAATWADDVKKLEGTGTWHYVDIPRGESSASLESYCEPVGPLENGTRRGCIISAISDQRAVLGNGTPVERARALRYLIHLIGDLHQPLHVSNNGDRGGNCVPLHFAKKSEVGNLHSLWDSGILDSALTARHLTEEDFAEQTDRRYREKFAEWTKSQSVERWALEVHEVAVQTAYGKLQPAVPVEPANIIADCTAESAKIRALNISIGDDYERSAMEAIEPLLVRAGYRLAGILNQVWQ
jgi:nuclease S1